MTNLVCGEYYKDINNLGVLLSKCATNISVCYLVSVCLYTLFIILSMISEFYFELFCLFVYSDHVRLGYPRSETGLDAKTSDR